MKKIWQFFLTVKYYFTPGNNRTWKDEWSFAEQIVYGWRVKK